MHNSCAFNGMTHVLIFFEPFVDLQGEGPPPYTPDEMVEAMWALAVLGRKEVRMISMYESPCSMACDYCSDGNVCSRR
jgi:hypothetical protein